MTEHNRTRPPITVTLDPDVVAAARLEARRRRCTLSRFVESAIVSACETSAPTPAQGAS